MGELLRGWRLSAVQKSNTNFRHFSKASLIHLNATSLQTRAETPVRTRFSGVFQLLRFLLENRTAKTYKTHAISSLKWWCTGNRERFRGGGSSL